MNFPSASLAGLLISLLLLFLVLTYTSTTFRVYIRTKKTKNFGLNDIFLLISVVLITMFTLFTILSTSHGIGSMPDDQVDSEQLSMALRYNFFATLMFLLAVTVLRVGACLFLFSLTNAKSQRMVIETFGIASTTYAVWYFFLLLLQCVPIDYYWESLLTSSSGGCLDPMSLAKQGYIFAFMSGFADFFLSLMPIWLLWEKKLDRKQKYGVAACIAGGFCAGTAAVLRIPATAILVHTENFFYDTVSLIACCIFELGFGAVALALAGLQISLQKVENKEGIIEEGKVDAPNDAKGKEIGKEVKRKEVPQRDEKV